MIITNSDLVMLQSRLFNPSYYGPGRWVIFNPRTRESFLAVGKDTFPPIVASLALATRGIDETSDYGSVATGLSATQLESLLANDLLELQSNCDVPASASSFLSRYHRAVFDYPFLDYSLPDYPETDGELMAHYANVAPPPCATTQRFGEVYALPEATVENLLPSDPNVAFSQNALSAVLKFTVGNIGELEKPYFGSRFRKTSPSGGGRHPTELAVHIHREFCGFSPGLYAYDVAAHTLVKESESDQQRSLQCETVTFVVRSRVERPMWRYRDIRALRPVLIDAGHIVETLTMLLESWGWYTTLERPPIQYSQMSHWLEEPALAVVNVYSKPQLGMMTTASSNTDYSYQADEALITNPASYLTFSNGALLAHIVWPICTSVPISLHELPVLSHCLLSLRGDRPSSYRELKSLVPELTEDRLAFLASRHVLLSEPIGRELYSKMGLWSHHGWYPSLLAHLECITNCNPPVFIAASRCAPVVNHNAFVTSLLTRKTWRRFCNCSMSIRTLDSILEAATPAIANSNSQCRLFVAPLAVDDLPNSIHEWLFSERRLIDRGLVLRRDEIASLTSGQKPAGAGAATIWILSKIDTDCPGTYELAIMQLGRLGQRICLAATSAGLGVFVTPAVSDARTLDALRLSEPLRWATYLLSIGVPHE
jgi:hypothetical protein